jgi:hypothetical protein
MSKCFLERLERNTSPSEDSQVATKFRAQAGESRSTVKAHAIPLVEATTPSLEAWKLYSAAWNLGFSENTSGAVSLLRRAIQIDPNFAMAYAFLVRVYGDTGQPALAAESIRKAYQLRDRATDQERFSSSEFLEKIAEENHFGLPSHHGEAQPCSVRRQFHLAEGFSRQTDDLSRWVTVESLRPDS